MQDVVNKINEMNRVLSRPLCVDSKGERASQVTVCTTNLEVGFLPQTRRKIKWLPAEIIVMDLRCGLPEAAPSRIGIQEVAYCGFMANVRDYPSCHFRN